MSPVQLIPALFKTENFQKASLVTLKPGQLVYGRVERFLPNDAAIIQIGDVKLLAHLKASLTIGDRYLFEVRSNGEDGIQLKVVEREGSQFLEQFQLPEAEILQSFSDKNLPFTREQLKIASEWLQTQADPKDLTALEWMIKKDLPFTKSIFQSLVAVQEGKSFSSQLADLTKILEDPKFATLKTIEPLKQIIATLLEDHSIDKLNTGTDVKQMLQTTVQTLGLEYENEIDQRLKKSNEPLNSLKPLLMNVIHELGSSGKELEPILNRLTGMQLLSQDLTGPMQQMVMQLPLIMGDKHTDVTLQWSGRKTSNGQIDSDFCRILFYLDLQHLNQTVIDMQIQNKVIHISVVNDTKEIEPIVRTFTPLLKEKLEGLGYSLSFIKVVSSFENVKQDSPKTNPIIFPGGSYQGVDIKI